MSEKKLTNRQKLFIDYYLQSFNAADAARKAGYSKKTAREQGYGLLQLPHISSQIGARLSEVHMSSEEALKLLADMARADLGDFTNNFGGVDWVEAKEKGLTKLVKKWEVKTVTINGKDEEKQIMTEKIELHDAKDAIDKILRVAGKYKDPGSEGNPLTIAIKKIGVDVDDV